MHEGAETRVGEDSELLEELDVKVGMLQVSVLSPFLFVVVVDVVTELEGEGVQIELYADDLISMSRSILGLRNRERDTNV